MGVLNGDSNWGFWNGILNGILNGDYKWGCYMGYLKWILVGVLCGDINWVFWRDFEGYFQWGLYEAGFFCPGTKKPMWELINFPRDPKILQIIRCFSSKILKSFFFHVFFGPIWKRHQSGFFCPEGGFCPGTKKPASYIEI